MMFWIIAALDVALAVVALTLRRYVQAMRRRTPNTGASFEDSRARELGYDPDACARGEHQWYVSWGFCQNPFCEALMPGLVRRYGQPWCPECEVVTTSGAPHEYGCTIGAKSGYVRMHA